MVLAVRLTTLVESWLESIVKQNCICLLAIIIYMSRYLVPGLLMIGLSDVLFSLELKDVSISSSSF